MNIPKDQPEDHLKINEKTNRSNMDKKNYIKRIKNGNSFKYTYKDGRPVNDKEALEKISHIYIAPAYRNVKIYLNSDLLAVGIDTKGRKQYVYSEEFKKKREKKKYCQLITLSGKIERLKSQINRDLKQDDYNLSKLIALVLKIMDLCNFRSGQRKMEKKYKSHGITTVHKDHVAITNNKVEIEFVGKKGVNNYCAIQDKPIQEILKKVYKLSTKNDPYLFSIKNEKGEDVYVTIDDLNNYLRPFQVTTKDLRTWNANIIFLKNLFNVLEEEEKEFTEMKNPTPQKELKLRKKVVREAIIKTAVLLHNTPSVCRSSYIYKSIVKNFEEDPKYMNAIVEMNHRNFNFENYLTKLLGESQNINHCTNRNKIKHQVMANKRIMGNLGNLMNKNNRKDGN